MYLIFCFRPLKWLRHLNIFMKILAIESSCDETACAIVEDGHKVLANTVASQIDIHAKTGGVVPEVAAREHVLQMIPVLDECLSDAKCGWEDIEAIAVTQGPGLVSSLMIGVETANTISFVEKKPLIPVQHIVGHIYSNWLDNEGKIEFPLIVLTVSGGHNEIILMKDHHDFEVLGETRDDAAGEAFDKVARMLGLGYPGGPIIAERALNGDINAFNLPIVLLEKDSLDFSFSGLKTAVFTLIKKFASDHGIDDPKNLDSGFVNDLSASFQETVVEILTKKTLRALERYPEVKRVLMAGGVSANLRLREILGSRLPDGVSLSFPQKIEYCTDNASMIASAGYFAYSKEPAKFCILNIIPTSWS